MAKTDQPPRKGSKNEDAASGQSHESGSSSAAPRGSNKKNAKRPSDSRGKQQKLSAWQPILTAGTVIPLFFIVGLIFAPIGVILYTSYKTVQEHCFDYTNSCIAVNEELRADNVSCQIVNNDKMLMDKIRNSSEPTCQCEIQLSINEDVVKPVFIYYRLTNYYQNHRRFMMSKSDLQLLGDYKEIYDAADSNCLSAFGKNSNGTVIYPCGAMANSLFNDTFYITRETWNGKNKIKEPVPILFTGIAWPADKQRYFNPTVSWDVVNKSVVKPPSWPKPIWEFSDKPGENGVKNESFMVWMHPASMPTFRKLHSRIDHDQQQFSHGLPAGNYTVRIGYNYPVNSFNGSKRFIISNTSWAGGKNPFLGVAFIAVGSLCIFTGFILLFIHIKFGKSLAEMAMLN